MIVVLVTDGIDGDSTGLFMNHNSLRRKQGTQNQFPRSRFGLVFRTAFPASLVHEQPGHDISMFSISL